MLFYVSPYVPKTAHGCRSFPGLSKGVWRFREKGLYGVAKNAETQGEKGLLIFFCWFDRINKRRNAEFYFGVGKEQAL